MLIVEDYVDAQVLYANHLCDAGYDVVLASDGESAIELAKRLRPRIILMDLALPGIDGWEATRRIRADLGYDASMTIIAVSAMVGEAARVEALRAGCDGFVAKPCGPDVIVSVVKTYLESNVA